MPLPADLAILDADGARKTIKAPLTPGQATMAESRPVAVASDQSAIPVNVANWPSSQAVSLAALPALGAGTAIIGKVGIDQTSPGTTNAFSLSYIGGSAVATGNGTAGAGTIRVTIASDNSPFPVNAAQSGTWNVNNIGGTISLPTGASTAANQATIIGYIDGLETLIAATNTKLDSLITAVTDTSDSPVTVHQPADVINYVPVLDTAAYAAGDVLAATAAISNVMRVNDGRANLLSLTGIDKSKQKPAMTILFYQTNVTSAAVNAANNLSDADQLNLLGFQRILAADWIDYANNSICCFKGATSPQLLLEAASGTKDVYAVCIIDAGTPTFAVGDLMFKLGVVQA
jgi:hypothetical protein